MSRWWFVGRPEWDTLQVWRDGPADEPIITLVEESPHFITGALVQSSYHDSYVDMIHCRITPPPKRQKRTSRKKRGGGPDV